LTEDTEKHERILAEARYDVAHPRPSVVAAIATLDLHAGQRVLDAGCGPGAQLGLLFDAVAPGGSVTGLDLDDDNLEVAAALRPDRVASGSLRITSGDITRLPFDTASFDASWTSLVLHHVDDPSAAVRELARVVSPGGLVAVLDGDDGASFPFLPWSPELEHRVRDAVMRGAAENYGGALDYTYLPYLGRELPRLLREAGLTDVSVRPVADIDTAPLDPHRETELQEWFRGWVDGRLRDYLAPRDRAAILNLVDRENPGYLLGSPDFFLCRTWLLVTGRVPR
jgi:ubiquinone/menaquinone biosynthesis C-methylase UbiE